MHGRAKCRRVLRQMFYFYKLWRSKHFNSNSLFSGFLYGMDYIFLLLPMLFQLRYSYTSYGWNYTFVVFGSEKTHSYYSTILDRSSIAYSPLSCRACVGATTAWRECGRWWSGSAQCPRPWRGVTPSSPIPGSWSFSSSWRTNLPEVSQVTLKH